MPESDIQGEIKEIEPRLRILIIDMQPTSGNAVRVSQELFGKDDESIKKFSNIAVTNIEYPSKSEMPSIVDREKNARLFVPESVEEFSAIVVTGSPFAAYSREGELAEWKQELFSLIRKANEKKIPFLGICFGEQVLAEAMGGKVIKMKSRSGQKLTEKGWATIKKAPGAINDPLLKNLPDEFIAPENHGDIVSNLPENSILLAEDEYGVQGFRIGKSWGFAFHPERNPKKVEMLLNDSDIQEEMAKQGKNVEDVKKLGRSYNSDLRKIFTNFLRYAWENKQ